MVLEKYGEDQLDRSCKKVLRTVKEERDILLNVKRRKANWVGHILRRRYLIKHGIDGKIEGSTETTGR